MNLQWFKLHFPELKKSIKTFMFRKLNKEQFSLLELFKFCNGIRIKNQRTYLSQIWLNLNSRDLETSEFDRIWHVGP
jgi:hypothetical protein